MVHDFDAPSLVAKIGPLWADCRLCSDDLLRCQVSGRDDFLNKAFVDKHGAVRGDRMAKPRPL